MFYLGPDRRAAQQLASVIIGVSGFRKILGGPWQPEDLTFIDMAKEQVLRGRGRVVLKWGKQRFELDHMMGQGGDTKGSDEVVGSPGGEAAQSQDEGGVLTVGHAMEAFKTQIAANALASESHKATMVGKIDSLKHVSPPDRGVAAIGYDELTSLVNRLASRLKSTSTGKKISAQTAINLVAAARQFFNWLRDSGKWEEPRGFERIFRINRKALLTNQERKVAAQGSAHRECDMPSRSPSRSSGQ